MGTLVTVCFIVAAVLAAIAAAYVPSSPARYNLLAAAIFFLCVGFAVQRLALPG